MKTKLISVSPNAEELMLYCARVSNPANQDSTNTKLLNYCISHGHWSVFETASMTIEIETSRAISAQILRHRSFNFQEFSQRYAEVQGCETYKARSQDEKNRQNSNDDLSVEDQTWFEVAQKKIQKEARDLYDEAIRRGIAKECARFLLPMSSSTRLYMTGNIRSWIHYIALRSANGTQLEHMEIANSIKEVFKQQLPVTSEALGWG